MIVDKDIPVGGINMDQKYINYKSFIEELENKFQTEQNSMLWFHVTTLRGAESIVQNGVLLLYRRIFNMILA